MIVSAPTTPRAIRPPTRPPRRWRWRGLLFLPAVAAGWLWLAGPPRAGATLPTLRVVCYNIQADIGGVTGPRPGLDTVLEAIGEEEVAGAPHPPDLLALEETTSNAATVAPIVAALNARYGPGTYALVDYQATQRGGAGNGNGPNAMVYNTATLQLLLQNGAPAVGVPGTPGTTGAGSPPRQAVRYRFLPRGAPAGADFFVYVSHMKSSATGEVANNLQARQAEAQAIVADVATLPAAHGGVLVVGDFNLTRASEAAYQTLTGGGAGPGARLLDAQNYPQDNAYNWNTTPWRALLTDATTSLRYRDDIHFMSPAVLLGATAAATTTPGLRYVAGSAHGFGNNGTTALGTSVNQATNTALNNLRGPVSAVQALAALVSASDHLPEVADYVIVATPYDAWQVQHFAGPALNDPAVSGDGADPDGDGVANLLEYALDLDPRRADAGGGLPTVGTIRVGGATYLTLTYTRVVAAVDLAYAPQVSGDLHAWQGGAGAVMPVSATTSADGRTQSVVVRDTVPLDKARARFMRLEVTRP